MFVHFVCLFSSFFFSFYLQEQLRRRREEEERIAQQNEFLRASLRGSRKLQALQDNHQIVNDRLPVGIDNDAFIADEDVERILGKFLLSVCSVLRALCSTLHFPWSVVHGYIHPK